MLKRVFGLASAAVALMVLVGGSVGAGDKEKATTGKTHEGTFVSVKGHKLTMEDKKSGKEHSHMVAKDAKVTCDGKKCDLTDLKAGVMIRVTIDDEKMACRIEARTKKGAPDTLDK